MWIARAIAAALGAGFVMAGVGWRYSSHKGGVMLALGLAAGVAVFVLCLPDRKRK